MVVLVWPKLSIIFINLINCVVQPGNWCGESHTLPYPGYVAIRHWSMSLISILKCLHGIAHLKNDNMDATCTSITK